MVGQATSLNRTLSLPVLTLYGLGTVVGAGIYVLVGKVAGLAGDKLAYAFLISGIVAVFTAFAYCELAARFPKAAGEALYVEKGFGSRFLSAVVGWLVVLTGIVSSATIANGFTGYLGVFVELPAAAAITLLMLFLGGVAAWGIKQSAFLVMTITLIEVGGLLFVIWAGSQTTDPQSVTAALSLPEGGEVVGVLLAAFLAFYAFIGFEDMVNLVEEVKNPRKTMPRAIILVIGLSVALYVSVALVAAYAVPISELSNSSAPLALIVSAGGFSPIFIAVVALVAVINGALVQLIMASRVLYGMARQNIAFSGLGFVSPLTRTPLVATVLVTAATLLAALWFPLGTLAKASSFVVLVVFILVNISLVVVKRRDKTTIPLFAVSIGIPIVGAVLSTALLAVQIWL